MREPDLVRYDVMVEDCDDGYRAGVLGSPALPRAGDRVSLYGPMFGDGKAGESGDEQFEVTAVYHEATVSERRAEDGTHGHAQVTVWVRSESQGPNFAPRCTCEPSSIVVDEDSDHCGNCNGRLPIGLKHKVGRAGIENALREAKVARLITRWAWLGDELVVRSAVTGEDHIRLMQALAKALPPGHTVTSLAGRQSAPG